MDSSFTKDESEEPNKEQDRSGSTGGLRRAFREQLDSLRERRRHLSEQDIVGRTPLFYAAEKGLEDEVREIIFSFRGTGMSPPRLALITQEDVLGLTAADLAEQNGHEEIASLLRSEQGRMEFFE